MAFDGKWKKVKVTNVDAIIKEIAPDGNPELVAKMTAYYNAPDHIEEIKTVGDINSRKIYMGGKLAHEYEKKFGVEFEMDTFLGKSKLKAVKISDTKVEITEQAGDRSAKSTLRIEGGKYYIDYTINGKTLVREFEKA